MDHTYPSIDQLLRPSILDIDPEAPSATKVWNHWRHKFENFARSAKVNDDEKLRLLINYVSANVYEHIRCCQTYKDAVTALKTCFSKPRTEVAARYRMLTRRQKSDETVDEYLEALRTLSQDCGFTAVSAVTYRDECIRDAFIAGLISPHARQKLLEQQTLSLTDAHAQAKSLELPGIDSDHSSESDFGRDCSDDSGNEAIAVDASITDTCKKNASTSALIRLVIDTRKPRSRMSKEEFTCYHCGKKTFHKDNLRKHVSLHFDDKPYACDKCNYRARIKSVLKLHMTIHSNEKPFACDKCSYRCRIKNQLRMHMRVHTGEKPYACVVCGFRANKKISLVKHVRRYHTGEKPFACNLCDYRTLQRDALKMHMNTHTGERPYACNFCDYRAAQRGTLNLHLARHAGQEGGTQSNRECKFACDQCDFKTYLKPYLYRHQWKTHKDREKKQICEVCGFKTVYASNLKLHMKIHTGEKPYTCETCGATFLRKAGLQLHMTTHSGERPYACQLCTYRTARKQHLSSHMRTHTGEKPYSCHVCGYRAAQSSTLASHMKIHSGEKKYACELCPFGTNKKSLFNQHSASHAEQAQVVVQEAQIQDQVQLHIPDPAHIQIQDPPHIQIGDQVQVQIADEVQVQIADHVQVQIQDQQQPQTAQSQTVQWHPVQLQTAPWHQGPPRMTTIAIPDLWSPGRF